VAEGRHVSIRSYRGVVDDVERRVFRLDRWRLPTPHGVSVRAILYALVCMAIVVVAASLPLIGIAVEAIPTSVRLLGLPVVGGWALASLQVDGRAPHHALAAGLRYLGCPRTLAGLRPGPRVGVQLAIVEAIQVAPTGDEPRYRRGRVSGPAWLTLRYPARIELEAVSPRAGGQPHGRLANARRVRVRPLPGRTRSMPVAKRLRVPQGKAVIFE
jgi:hypothetical protein